MSRHLSRLSLLAMTTILSLSGVACSEKSKAVETEQTQATETVSNENTQLAAADDNDAHANHNHAKGEAAVSPEMDNDFVYSFAPEDFLVGSDAAPIKIILYASVTCGHCSAWFQDEWPTVKKDYIDTGKVQMAFREIPTPPQELAAAGFSLAACAPEDQYMDLIVHQMEIQEDVFASLKNGTIETTYKEIGKKAGLETDEAFIGCLNDPSHTARINKSIERMTAANLRGVPSVIIDGEVHQNPDKSAKTLAAIFDAK